MYIHSHGGGSSTKKWHRYCLLHTPFGGSLLPREVRGGGTLVSDPLALRFLDARGRAGLCVGVFSGLFFWIEDDGNKRKRRGRGRGEEWERGGEGVEKGTVNNAVKPHEYSDSKTTPHNSMHCTILRWARYIHVHCTCTCTLYMQNVTVGCYTCSTYITHRYTCRRLHTSALLTISGFPGSNTALPPLPCFGAERGVGERR